MSDHGITPPEQIRTRGPLPTGTRLVLIRHGEADVNVNGLIGGHGACTGLTDLGRRQALALRDRLAMSGEFTEASALYTSILPRAIETAAILAPSLPAGLQALQDCNLCELHPGEADGLSWSEFTEQYGVPDWDRDPDIPWSPGAESWTGFYDRVTSTLIEIAERHEGELVIAVVHGGVVEQALKLAYNSARGDRLRLRTENCSMTEVEFRDGRWHLLRYNDRAPLPGAPTSS